MKKYIWFSIPVSIVILLLYLDPLIRGLWLAFTDYNMINTPVLNYGRNFVSILKDRIFIGSLFNMFIFTLISTIFGGFISYIIYRASCEWNKPVRIIWSIVLVLLSMICLIPMSTTLFSSDSYGFINGTLMNANLIEQPIVFLLNPVFIKFLSVNLTMLTMIGPLYVFFNASKASTRMKLVIAANIGIIVNLITSFTQITLFGFPSTDYCVHNPILHMFDYMLIRFDVGYMCALIIITLVILVFISFILSAIAILVSLIKTGQKPLLLTKIAGSTMFCFSVPFVIFTFVVNTSDLFKPMSERFIFPPSLFAIRPSLENFEAFLQNDSWIKILVALTAQTIIGGLLFGVVILTASFALSKIFGSKSVKLERILIVSGLIIAIISPIYALRIEPVIYYTQLGFYSSIMTPLFMASLFVVAKAIEKKNYLSGIFAGLMIFLLGSFINSNIFPMSNIPGLWTLLLQIQNSSRDFVSPYIITTIFNITAITATLLTAVALYEPSTPTPTSTSKPVETHFEQILESSPKIKSEVPLESSQESLQE